MNFNQVTLAGNLCSDPELTYTDKGMSVTKFRLAVNNKRYNETLFIRCTAFGTAAEVLAKYISKGRPILVSGRLQQNQWTDDNNNQHDIIDVIVRDFQFVGNKADKPEKDISNEEEF